MSDETSKEARQNVLFGWLAVQLGFIDSHQLTDAVGQWETSEESDLGKLLVRLEYFDQVIDDRDRLVAIVIRPSRRVALEAAEQWHALVLADCIKRAHGCE